MSDQIAGNTDRIQPLDEVTRVSSGITDDDLLNENVKTPVEPGKDKTEKKARVLSVLGGGMFSAGQDVMNEDLVNSIKELVPDIKSFPDYRVIINGHTDNMPIKSTFGKRYLDNMELSLLRAKAVSKILVDNGISNERISVEGYGDTRPIASNDTEEGRARNRRVEIELIPVNEEM